MVINVMELIAPAYSPMYSWGLYFLERHTGTFLAWLAYSLVVIRLVARLVILCMAGWLGLGLCMVIMVVARLEVLRPSC